MLQRTCKVCLTTSPLSNFSKRVRGQKAWYGWTCKPCINSQQRARLTPKKTAEYTAAKRKRDPTARRRYGLKALYGLTPQDYERLLAQQEGRCAICKTETPGGRFGANTHFHVDHCHDANFVRGLLCANCNNGLGRFKHQVDILEQAVEYLRKCRLPRFPVSYDDRPASLQDRGVVTLSGGATQRGASEAGSSITQTWPRSSTSTQSAWQTEC